MLKYWYQKEDEVPAEHKALYTKKKIQLAREDGTEYDVEAYVLNVSGVVPKERHDAFRLKNTKLTGDLENATARLEGFGDIKPEDAKAALDKLGKLKDKKIVEEGDLENAVKTRTAALEAAQKKALEELNLKLTTTSKKLSETLIDRAVIDVATKQKLRPEAVLDITTRARSIFSLNEQGAVVAFEPDGKTVKYDPSGAAPYTIDQWVGEMVVSAPHLFQGSSGGGAPGSGSGGAPKVNPWKRGEGGGWNLTEQMRIQKENPQLAAKLKAEAGIK